ncbi:MAG: hypothetical protein JSW03_08320 [Candidatus Eiseniibacteriota bacterium]|nr:MAG: hypothetical protein JSW03_08320 [Candidatus Eisenbacteria bacterium]
MAKRKREAGKPSAARSAKRAPSARSSRATGPLPEVAAIALIVLMVVLVYHRALQYFFFQDDFVSLWIAREGPGTLWRVLSSYAYFGLARAVFGLNPTAFHLLSMLFHVASAVLVFFIARALSCGRGPSLFASSLFAVHPSLFVPLYAISSIGEILSCFFALSAALYLLVSIRPWAPGAIIAVSALFVASLLSKETTILFPLLVLPVFAARSMPLKRAVPLLAVLVAIAAGYGGFLYAQNVFGIREAAPETGPYHLAVGPELVTSLQTYFKWAFNVVESWRNKPFNVLDEEALPWLLAGAGVLAALLAGSGAGRRRVGFCLIWFFVMLLPVVPLAGHPYHYYLYIPLAGLAPAVGVFLTERLKKGQMQLAVSAALTVVMVIHSALLVARIESATVDQSRTRQEPTFDRAIVSGNLISDLTPRQLPDGAKLLLISPLDDLRAGRLTEHPHILKGGPYWDSNLRSAVAEGIGIRLFFPQVDTVAFSERMSPEFEGFLPLLYTWDGHLRRVKPAQTWTEAGLRYMHENPAFARTCFRNAVEDDSLYADAYYQLARMSLSEARFSEAADALRKFLSTAGTDVRREGARKVLRGLEARGY